MTELSLWIADRRAELEAATPDKWGLVRSHEGWDIAPFITDNAGMQLRDAGHIVSAHNTYGAMLDVIAAAAASHGPSSEEGRCLCGDRGFCQEWAALAALAEAKS